MAKILVTGATGNVGRHVVGELIRHGVGVRAFVRDPQAGSALLDGAVDLAVGDFSDPGTIRAALAGVDGLFLACANHPRQVEFETNAIAAAAAAGTPRVVKLSAFGAQVGSPLGFWDWHGRIEAHLQDSGLAATILRPATYMSSLFAAADTVRDAGAVFAPAGDAKIAMIDPRDVAATAAAALAGDGHDGMTYTLTGPETITYSDVAQQLSAVTGREIAFVDVPEEAARQTMVQAGMPQWLVDNLATLFTLIRQGVMAHTTDTVRDLTGRTPRNFSAFARDHAAVFAG